MIQVAIAACLVWALFSLLDKSGAIDGFTAITLVLAPALLVFVLKMTYLLIEWPLWVAYLFELAYFLVPLVLIKNITEYAWPKISAYAGAVFAIHILSAVLVSVLLGA